MSDVDDFVKFIKNRGYPSSLTESQVRQAWSDASIEMQLMTPLLKTGYFDVVENKQIYDVYGRIDASAPELIDAMGYQTIDVTWAGTGNAVSDVFLQGPLLGPYNGSPVLPFSSSRWRQPDLVIYEMDIQAMREAFFQYGYDPVDNDPRSPIKLTPMPTNGTGRAYVRYIALRDPSTIESLSPMAYEKIAEACLCDTIARKEMADAGKEFALFKDKGIAPKLWKTEAAELRARARAILDKASVFAISAAMRD